MRHAHRSRTNAWSVTLALAMVLFGGIVGSGCGSASGASGGNGGSGTTITLYNAQHQQTTDALVKAFTQRTGIHVRVESNNEDILTAQIEQEGGRSSADVFYSENSNWTQQLADRKLLAKVDPSTLANVPERDSAPDGTWVGVSARISAMVYNPTKITASQLPNSVLGMANPRYKGKIEIAPAETDFWPIVSSVAGADGDSRALAWLKGLNANAGAGDNVPDSETLISDVSHGVTDFALIDHYYFYRLRAEVGNGSLHAKLAYFAPGDPGYVEDISAAGVLRSSTHQKAAQEFVAFLTSTAGQRVLASGDSFEYPIHPGIGANPQLTPLAQLKPSSFSPQELGAGLNAQKLLQQAGLI